VTLKELQPATRVRVLVGPEGGLEDSEINAAEVNGYQTVRLGPRILRTETAALATLTALQILWGDLAGQASSAT
jgi:16S rRNA (uracil1498-N3)-methyltransferase